MKRKSSDRETWKVMLDAAAFVPSNPLDLTEFPADFVSISFYKMFGYPTGLGALLIRTENVALMNKVGLPPPLLHCSPRSSSPLLSAGLQGLKNQGLSTT